MTEVNIVQHFATLRQAAVLAELSLSHGRYKDYNDMMKVVSEQCAILNDFVVKLLGAKTNEKEANQREDKTNPIGDEATKQQSGNKTKSKRRK